MIGIITYVSVVERIKEIGVNRSNLYYWSGVRPYRNRLYLFRLMDHKPDYLQFTGY